MSGYYTGNTDLASSLESRFMPLIYGSAYPTATGFKVNGQDLITFFAAYPGSGPKAAATGFTVNGNDLCNIFAKSGSFFGIAVSNKSNLSFSSTVTGGYIVYTFTSTVSNSGSGNCTVSFSISTTISAILVGSGGNGGDGINQYNGGGAGGGSFTHATASVIAGNNYSLRVGGRKQLNAPLVTPPESSLLQGGSVSLSAAPGSNGEDATTTSSGSGGTSGDGGNGGKGGCAALVSMRPSTMASNIANEERIRTEPRRITVSARHSNRA